MPQAVETSLAFSSSKTPHQPYTACVIPCLLVLLCLSLLFLHRCLCSPILLLLWKLSLNPPFDDHLNRMHFQIFFENFSVSLFILIISLTTLNLSIGYSISPDVTRYGISNVDELVSSHI